MEAARRPMPRAKPLLERLLRNRLESNRLPHMPITPELAALSGQERLLMALQMFETAQQIVLSSLDSALGAAARIVPAFLRRPSGPASFSSAG